MMRSKRSELVASVAVVVFAWAPLARAASAMIVAPGAQARAQPSETAAVLQTYATGDKVFVSPEITAGFRRVALPDKRIGFIRDDDVRVEGAPAPVQPLSTAHSLFIVQDIDQLADLTKGDPLLGPRARNLIHTRHAAVGVGVAAGAAALLIAPLALAFTDTQCVGSGSNQLCQQAPNFTFGYVAMGVLLVGGIVALAIGASGENPVDFLNVWNQHHPDRPLTLAPGAIATPDSSPPPDMTPPPTSPPPPMPIPGVDFPIGPPPS
jgi:hypothetical protein